MKAKLEVVPHKVDSSIAAFYYNENHFDAPWHYHDELELTYITQSSGVRYVGNSIKSFQPGDMVLNGPLLPHSWQNAPNYQGGASSIYVQWLAEEFTEIITKLTEFHSIKTMLDRANSGIFFKASKEVHLIGNRLMALPALSGAQQIMNFIDILLELSYINNYDLLSEPGNHFFRYRETDNRVKDIFAFIDENYVRKISVDNMADLTFMTKSSFCKFFKNYFNKTFTQYLNEYRIHRICRELQETAMPVSQIALNCGYENMSYFHRQFKSVTGMTPASYRLKYDGSY
ncbi:AraC family transcriptional regulator [Labilibacter marinus]|uniref:AraC family transcriptional regulator n=1 Tax=Labilibacter marinus TaxID=1477105 RepID=UPI00083529B6|nr:AraC family transcriptional regulator [Labilibacter marinus]